MISFEEIGDATLKACVQLPARPEKVYRAWTDPQQLVRWFRGTADGRLEIHAFDCREGGAYDVTMVSANGDRFNLVGKYLTLEPNRRIVMTWAWASAEPDPTPMQVTVDVAQNDAGSLLTLTHERFASPEVRTMHHHGWAPCLQNLVGFLSHANDGA